MDDFSDRVNAPATKLRWLNNVERILPSDTPDTLSMQDGDCRDADFRILCKKRFSMNRKRILG